jgi:hypothetical protein
MQQQAMNSKQRLYCNMGQHLHGKYLWESMASDILQQRRGKVRDSATASRVSNGFGLPGFILGWNWNRGSSLGQEPRRNPTRCVLAGLIPAPNLETWNFGFVGTGLWFELYGS